MSREIVPSFRFRLSTNLRFGAGESEKLGEEISDLGYTRVAAIADKGVIDHPQVKKALDSVVRAGHHLDVYQSVAVEPEYDYLESLRAQLAGKGYDCLVGIGGGSAMDLAKGLAVLLTNEGAAISFRGFPKLDHRPLPVVEIPTTAGTGSEVTYNAVFTDGKEGKKLGINSVLNFPAAAIVDPLITVDCPRQVAVSAGADAMVHAMESFVTKHHTVISRMCSKEAFRLLFPGLAETADGHASNAVTGDLAVGSYLAGIALMNSGGGIVGALSYQLGVRHQVPHGLAGGVFLPHLTSLNISKGYTDYAELYALIEGAELHLSTEEKAVRLGQELHGLWNRLDIPRTLSVFGLDREDVEFLIARYDDLRPAIEQNPVEITRQEFRRWLEGMA